MTAIDPPEVANLRDPRQQEASSAPPADEETAPERVRSLLQQVGSVVAPTTMLTALLIYFGWAYSANYVRYFGLDYSLMGFTTQDYVIGSVQALFRPLAVAFSGAMLIVWAHVRLKARIFVGPNVKRRLRLAVWTSAVCGLVLFALGMAGIFVIKGDTRYNVWLNLSLGAGAILLAYASRLHARPERSAGAMTGRSTGLLEVTAAFFLVSLSLFWAATNYAAVVGEKNARGLENALPSTPEATLYSKEPLYLEAPGVRETSCDQTGGYRFRYQGLRLMIRSGGNYFFLPADWSRADGEAVVVPVSDAVRVQFAARPQDGPRRSAAIACPSPRPGPP